MTSRKTRRFAIASRLALHGPLHSVASVDDVVVDLVGSAVELALRAVLSVDDVVVDLVVGVSERALRIVPGVDNRTVRLADGIAPGVLRVRHLRRQPERAEHSHLEKERLAHGLPPPAASLPGSNVVAREGAASTARLNRPGPLSSPGRTRFPLDEGQAQGTGDRLEDRLEAIFVRAEQTRERDQVIEAK